MTYIIVFRDDVLLELNSQSILHEKSRKGLGELFVLDFEETINVLKTFPYAFRAQYSEWRIIPLKRFEFVIVYRVNSDTVYVVSVVHARSDVRKMLTKRNGDESTVVA